MNRTFLTFIFISTLCSNSLAKDVTVYKWVDDRGIVHYGQHEPLSEDYSELKVNTSYSPIQAPLKDIVADDKNLNESLQLASVSTIQCKNAQAKLRTLSDFEKIEMTDASGKSRLLSQSEKNQQLRLSEKEVEIYCSQ